MDDPLMKMIDRIEKDYQIEIEKWKGIKKTHIKEVEEAEKEILNNQKKLDVLQRQKGKLNG